MEKMATEREPRQVNCLAIVDVSWLVKMHAKYNQVELVWALIPERM